MWFFVFFYSVTDAIQGNVYRILYIHVPSAATAFCATTALFVSSLYGLMKPKENNAFFSLCACEVALFFTIITLLTGSIWGKPTWGTWWTWDARLTTTLLLAILLFGYMFLWHALEDNRTRNRSLGVVGIFIFMDLPIIYKSVTWWRTLHQPPSLFRETGTTMSPEIVTCLIVATVSLLLFGAWCLWQRFSNLLLREQIELEATSTVEG